MAEICRRVAAVAEQLGLLRPSYVHLRTLLREEREQQDYERARHEQIRAIAADVATDIARGLGVDAYEVADAVREAGKKT